MVYHTEGLQVIRAFKLLSNLKVKGDYDHHFWMMKQLPQRLSHLPRVTQLGKEEEKESYPSHLGSVLIHLE